MIFSAGNQYITNMRRPKYILPIIVFAQFCCTSLWFASNGVISDLISSFQLQEAALGHLTSAVQFGFITGTLVFAFLTISDRIAPSTVFLLSAMTAAVFNLAVVWEGNSLYTLLILRFGTGFFLAGIYPVGMKIAADYYRVGLGKSLGYLVGALVVGTAFPHLLRGLGASVPWRLVITITSVLATLGGLLMYFLVPNGPFRKANQGFDLLAFTKVFKSQDFRSAAFGYFGHMWELYAFWAFVPAILASHNLMHPGADLNVSLWSFTIIAVGGLSCVAGGYISIRLGARKTAIIALSCSGLCCLLSPVLFVVDSKLLFLCFLHFWGIVVIADSPMFSTLVAQSAIPELKGTALTIVNCIGFAITIVSIQLLTQLVESYDPSFVYLLLAVGPVFGILAVLKERKTVV